MNIEIIISALAIAGAGLKWIFEYSKQLNWDRNKFLLDRIEAFRQKQNTKLMETILDYNTSVVKKNDVVVIQMNDDFLYECLQTHDAKSAFTQEEVIIRNCFDEYFDDLTTFAVMVDSKLIDKKNFIRYLKYWLIRISDKCDSKPEKVVKQIQKYLTFYGFNELQLFIKENI